MSGKVQLVAVANFDRATGLAPSDEFDAAGNPKGQPIVQSVCKGATFEAGTDEASELLRRGLAVESASADAQFLADVGALFKGSRA